MALAFWLPRDLTERTPEGEPTNGWCVGAWLRWSTYSSGFRLIVPGAQPGDPETAFTVLATDRVQVTRERGASTEAARVGRPIRGKEWLHLAIGQRIEEQPTAEILLNGVVIGRLPGAPGRKLPSLITFSSRQAIADPIFVPGYGPDVPQRALSAAVPEFRLLRTLPAGAVSVRHPLPGVPLTGNTMGLADLIDTVSGNVAGIYEQQKDLGAVTLDLKVVPSDTSGVVTLPVLLDDKGQALEKPLDSQALTTVHLEFAPPPPPPPKPPAQLPVPSLEGLTEVLARRLAEAAGFSLELFSQFEGRPEASGRVVRQHPAAGALAPRGTTMLAFLGQG